MLLTEYNEAEVMELFKEDGRKEGRKEEAHTINSVNSRLFKLGRIEDVRRAANDPSIIEALINENNECHEKKLT